MKFLTIDKRMACQGNIQFTLEPFFKLPVNTFVTQIGDGRETGCYRTDTFARPFKYVGSFINKQTKYFAFKVPKELLPQTEENYYMLYESTGLEILCRHVSYVRFYTPNFSV